MQSSLKNKVIFMTGATSGLGKISALKAARDGASLIVLARSIEKGQKLIQDFHDQYPESQGKIEIIEGSLSSFNSVKNVCDQVILKYPVIDFIVNNAGIMNFTYIESTDHIEETFQVNLVSPFLICHLLFDPLKKSKDAKIIFTSSGLHQGEINFQNLEFKTGFTSFTVYRQSKLGVIMLCRCLAESLKEHNVSIYTLNPGMVRTELGRNAGWFSRMIFKLMGKSPEEGSQTLSFLMETPKEQLKSGEYYSGKKITTTTKESYDMTVAKKLLETVNDYLKNYITSKSPILKLE